MNPEVIAVALAAYLVGSLPFGYWIGLMHGVNIREIGSGNIGATNVWRVLGWKAGLPVLIMDIAKGAGPALAAGLLLSETGGYSPDYALLGGALASVGHMTSPFLGFRGGKGVATALGVVIAVSPVVAALILLVFAAVFSLTRYVSLASLLAAISAPIFTSLAGYSVIVVGVYALLALFIIFRHRSNIGRLIRGEESRFSPKSGKEEPVSDEPQQSGNP